MRAFLLMTCLALGLPAGATDHAEIQRDLTAMKHILRGVLKAEGECCNASIDAMYLAKQGIVFSVTLPGFLREFAFRVGGDTPFGIPEDITESLEDIELNFELMREKGAPGVFFFTDESPERTAEDRQTRVSMREAARALRDLSQQIAEKEIELIHLEDAGDRIDVVAEMDSLNTQLAEQQAYLGELQARLQARSDNLVQQQAARRAEAAAAKQKQVQQLEEALLRSFCDYGGTLKRLPANEYVNIVIDTGGDEAGNHFFVFRQPDITRCESGPAELRKRAITYRF